MDYSHNFYVKDNLVQDFWNRAINRLSEKITAQNLEMWLKPIECRSMDEKTIVLRAPNPYVRTWFESNYLPIVLDEITRETQVKYAVNFEPDHTNIPQIPNLSSEPSLGTPPQGNPKYNSNQFESRSETPKPPPTTNLFRNPHNTLHHPNPNTIQSKNLNQSNLAVG